LHGVGGIIETLDLTVRHYAVQLTIEPSLPLTFRPAIFSFGLSSVARTAKNLPRRRVGRHFCPLESVFWREDINVVTF
jgi:hypothetical protein